MSKGNTQKKRVFKGKDITPPGTLNIIISIASILAGIAILALASKTESTIVFILCLIAFALINNTIFAMLHEAVHGVLHTNRKINNNVGRALAAMYPTSFAVQKVCQLGHHMRNRTDMEFFEAYTDRDNKTFKYISLYAILIGIYWTYSPLGNLWLLIAPNSLKNSIFRDKDKTGVGHIGGEGMLGALDNLSDKEINTMRIEFLGSLIFQTSLFIFLGVKFLPWLACYWAFALKWCSIQYADHAYSPRDVRNGAWNLKAPKFVQKVFLNYHYHLVHHRYPHIPWDKLPNFVEPDMPWVSHWEIYKKMWKGPIKVNNDAKVIYGDDELRSLVYSDAFVN